MTKNDDKKLETVTDNLQPLESPEDISQLALQVAQDLAVPESVIQVSVDQQDFQESVARAISLVLRDLQVPHTVAPRPEGGWLITIPDIGSEGVISSFEDPYFNDKVKPALN